LQLKTFFLFFLSFFLISSVYAGSATSSYFPPNSQQKLYGACLDSSNNLVSSSANLTVYYPDTSIFVNNQLMTVYDVGLHYYNITVPSTTGVYSWSIDCSSGGNGFGTFEVIDINKEVDRIMFLSLFFLISIAIMLIVIGYKYNAPLYHIMAGIWVIGFSAVAASYLFGGLFSLGMFFMAAWGFYLIWVGGSKMMD
jgi:hypothetical protein